MSAAMTEQEAYDCGAYAKSRGLTIAGYMPNMSSNLQHAWRRGFREWNNLSQIVKNEIMERKGVS